MRSPSDPGPERGPGKRRPPATPGQMAAREADAAARSSTQERKRRTRELIAMGSVMRAWGYDTPGQAEELMRTLTDPSRKGWRRYLLGALGVRRTDRWPDR